jgi:nitroreductase
VIGRRTALRLGGTTALVAGAALVARAVDQGLVVDLGSPGLQAWDDWNDRRYAGPLALVSAGVLASSPHNTQPWRFAIGRHGVDIFEVPARALGAMDPFGRERLLGLGAAIHNMALASTGIDRAAIVRLLPDPANPGHVARLELGPDDVVRTPHPLLAVIGRRHTDRGAYAGGPLTTAQMAQLGAAARAPDVRIAILDPATQRGKTFAALTIDATAAITSDAEMMAASHRWFRHSRRDRDRLKDGLSVATSGVTPLLAAAAAMLPEQSAASEGRYWLAATRDAALPTASAFALILVRNLADRRSGLLAGGAWQRFHLIATSLGLVVQPLNQLPEMVDRERQRGQPPRFAGAIDALLDDPSWRPTFALRLGHPATPASPSPRRPVSEVIGEPARLGFDIERARAETAGQDAALQRKLGGRRRHAVPPGAIMH